MGNMAGCTTHALETREAIEPTLTAAGYTVNPLGANPFTFCVFWPGSSVGVSISCPPDRNEHAERTKYVDAIALVSTNNVPVYEYDAGYDDVCHFDTSLKLLTEVCRLRAYFTANPMIIAGAIPHTR
jgi:hypothetical protein